jgi:hypothetical protein
MLNSPAALPPFHEPVSPQFFNCFGSCYIHGVWDVNGYMQNGWSRG